MLKVDLYFKHLKQRINKLYVSVDSESVDDSLISEKIDLVRKALKNHSKNYRNIIGDNSSIDVKELEFLLTFWYLKVTKKFTGHQLIRIIISQPPNIQKYFQGELIRTLSEFKDIFQIHGILIEKKKKKIR